MAARIGTRGLRFLACCVVFAAACIPIARSPVPQAVVVGPTEFSPSSLCRNCHSSLAAQHDESMHARSFSNPVFQTQYFDHYLPEFVQNPESFVHEPQCLSCHAPISYLAGNDLAEHDPAGDALAVSVVTADEPAASTPDVHEVAGVTCDVCHRISGYDGERPGNGNFIAVPGDVKLGPYQYDNDHHRAYSELHTTSEFCAMCHSSTNRHGVPIRTTYDEWLTSPMASVGVQCQDCHMNEDGFLTDGVASFQSGQAAVMSIGSAPVREKLYTHRFVGAHSATQIEGALTIEIDSRRAEPLPGSRLLFGVTVHNEKAGHKVPTGSSELRSAWLDVTARVGDRELDVVLGGDRVPYGVTGAARGDLVFLGDEVPKGRRIYRAVFVGIDKKPTYIAYNAIRQVFDNRLEAGEVRTELYSIDLPPDLEGEIAIEATMYYLRYPGAFAAELGLDKSLGVPIAHGETAIAVLDRPGP